MNRFEAEEDLAGVSASAKKLKTGAPQDVRVDPMFSYCFIAFVSVFSQLSEHIVCRSCHSKVQFHQSSKRGLGFKIDIVCETCGKNDGEKVTASVPNSPFIRNAYDINRRIILAMRMIGVGMNGLLKFCGFMDIPRPMFQSLYDKIVKSISVATESARNASMKRAAEEEIELSAENGQTIGITVSGDGTWRKRGFSSLYGVVTLIGWITGKVVDIVVKSSYCKACEYWNKKEDTEEYREWVETHEEDCQANHTGSSGKMEVDAGKEMFARSIRLYGKPYVHYIGDGDSKTFKGIVESNPYAALNLKVEKKECIGHVQKRMGSRLRTLVKSKKGLSGRGKLTGKLMDELSKYYGLAIRRNPDSVENMKRDIWATLSHKLSTDQEPQHDSCPAGVNSWCTWQRAKAEGKLDEHEHNKPLSNEVYEAIKPIYEDLSKDDLLKRCLGGYTQNSNESFNALLWSMAPKTVSSGYKVLTVCSDLAVCIFNDGISSVMDVMSILGLTVGENCYSYCSEYDERRVEYSERSLTEKAKEARLALKSSRREEKEANVSLEGPMYGAGIAD